MLQIIIWMGCLYLFLKGKELQFIAACTPNDDNGDNLRHAKSMSLIAYIGAGIFFAFSLMQGSSIPGLTIN